jgi:hypothetical protein
MDQSNIAKVLDAGATEQGRPYFVMELVKGVPIARYCDEKHLTPRERLELFIPVCQAVQHAHQQGIIHRDLKPSNVVVGLYDGQPIPKIIDFGVAKAAGPKLTEATLFTGFGTVIGTPEYMSPEQAHLDNLEIDTRSDIYSLGVLLYELLTGTTLFTKKDLERAGLLEMLRVIREQEPTKPSSKLSTAEGLPTLAANRGTEPAKPAKLVRGELDWIVMKCLEKDRNRRYDTVNGLVADLRRYLDDEPVQACPPSARYRLEKFARRNRVALIAVGLITIALLVGLGTLAVSNVMIKREQDQKEAALQKAKASEQEANAQRGRAEHKHAEAARVVDRMPVLSYSTYLGGKDNDFGQAIAVGGAGNAYVTGYTTLSDFPVTTGAFLLRKHGGIHVTEGFVTKIVINGAWRSVVIRSPVRILRTIALIVRNMRTMMLSGADTRGR